MDRTGGVVVAVAAVLALASCGSAPQDPFLAAAQGTWTQCETSSLGVAYRHRLTIDGEGKRYDYTMSWDTRGSCTSAGVVAKEVHGTIAVGGATTVGWDRRPDVAPVTAYPFDVVGAWVEPHTGPFQEFNLGYVDAGVTPNRLYLGIPPDAQTGSEPTPPRPTTLCWFWLDRS